MCFCVGKLQLNSSSYRLLNIYYPEFEQVMTLLLPQTSILAKAKNEKAEVIIYFYFNLY
jgi:hypothetical protein